MTILIELSESEWNSLKELRKGPLKKRIPVAHQEKLIRLGLAKVLFETISITAEGLRCHCRISSPDAPPNSQPKSCSLHLVLAPDEDVPPTA